MFQTNLHSRGGKTEGEEKSSCGHPFRKIPSENLSLLSWSSSQKFTVRWHVWTRERHREPRET